MPTVSAIALMRGSNGGSSLGVIPSVSSCVVRSAGEAASTIIHAPRRMPCSASTARTSPTASLERIRFDRRHRDRSERRAGEHPDHVAGAPDLLVRVVGRGFREIVVRKEGGTPDRGRDRALDCHAAIIDDALQRVLIGTRR